MVMNFNFPQKWRSKWFWTLSETVGSEKNNGVSIPPAIDRSSIYAPSVWFM